MNNCQPNCGCKFEVDSSCVRYTAVNLGTTLINVGDTIETTIIKIDQAITNLQQTIINNNTTGSTLQISGPIDRVVKFGPVSNPLLPSQTIDDGTSIGINANPDSSNKVLIETSSNQSGLKVSSLNNGKEAIIASSQATGSIVNKGIVSLVSGSTISNIGTETSATGASNINVGISSTAIGGTSNYSAQLKDGSETTQGGKFLKDTGSGKANWNYIYLADIQDYQAPTSFSIPIATNTILGGIKVGNGLSITSQGVLSSNIGQGTLNYIAKFTPDGYSIDDSQIIDDGTSIGIGTSPNSFYKIFLIGSVGGGIWSEVNSGSNDGVGLLGKAQIVGGTHPSGNSGVVGYGLSSDVLNVGISGNAYGNSAATTLNIGGKFESGTGVTSIGIYANATSSTNRYAAQLKDGTETVAGRFLKNMTTDGKANWANITAADVSGIQGAISLTTTGTSGAATLVGNTLNIPNYTSQSVTGYLKQDGTTPLTANWYAGEFQISANKFVSTKDSVFNGVYVGVSGVGTVQTNVAIGSCLFKDTTGLYNVAVGVSALGENTTGSYNTAVGVLTLADNVAGSNNCGFGEESLRKAKADGNSAFGVQSLSANVSGSNNVAIGYKSLYSSESSTTVAIGVQSGTQPQTYTAMSTSQSIFIGYHTKPKLTTSTNEIVIGYNMTGNGDNTTTIGNTSTTDWYMHGNMNIKNTSGVTTQTVSQTKYLPITINGVTYKLLLAD